MKKDTKDKTLVIEPVTRIEGHARITLHLNGQGVVEQAMLHVTQFRGFEKFCEGRPFYEMPPLMARICGICPVSHLVASAKACDDLFSVKIPPTAKKLRQTMNLAQMIQSHALSFFHLSSPDLLLGMDHDPATRNLFGVLAADPETARDGIRLRQFGQQIIEQLGGKRVHPAWIVPGGVSEPLTAEHRDQILSALPEAREIAMRTLTRFKKTIEKFEVEIGAFGNFPSLFLGLVDDEGNLEHYDGFLRVMDSAGNIIVNKLDTIEYHKIIAEAVEPWSYTKFPYYRPMGYPQGMYRVGPLARLNVADRCGTPLADIELDDFRELTGHPCLSSFHYHWARLIEILHCIERMEQLLTDDGILNKHVRAWAVPNSFDGVGVAEAPRGTLIHHYKIDEQGVMLSANLIIATGHNNLAMNRSLLQVARAFVDGNRLQEGMLNRVEAVVRAFDPCLSCSSHAAGKMPLTIQLFAESGELLSEVARSS
ncbi:Ni/Fe hydrogenase subunit alpha [bacterium]|nr:Ni/Fe hydrogenase subunit alpha [bacterium]MBU1984527.1 Ni/Fe hydrogenase subunit alpha [bacterium]